MKLLHKFSIGLGALLTDIVLLCCCLYMTVFANRMEAVTPNYLLWIGLVVLCFLVNLFIAKKGKQLTLLLVWNIVWMAVTVVLAALTFQCQPVSVPLKIFVCGVLIVIEGHSIAQTLLPQRASTQLTFLDVLVVVFAIFLAGCHLKGLDNVIGLQILGFICVGYTLVALIFLRTYEEQVNTVKGESVANRVKVFGLLGVIVAISCIACGALTVMARNAGSGLIDIILLMVQGLKKGLLSIGTVFETLFSKIPYTMGDTGVLPQISTGETQAEETGAEAVAGLPEWVFPLVGIIVVAIIIFFIIRLIWRLRKEKIQFSEKAFRKVDITASEITTDKQSWLKRLIKRWQLRLKMYRERKTTEGLAMLIRRSGKAVGLEMQPEDSWHGYVLKLIPYGDQAQLLELSNYLKTYFYSGKGQPLTREQYQHFSNCLKQLKKQEL